MCDFRLHFSGASLASLGRHLGVFISLQSGWIPGWLCLGIGCVSQISQQVTELSYPMLSRSGTSSLSSLGPSNAGASQGIPGSGDAAYKWCCSWWFSGTACWPAGARRRWWWWPIIVGVNYFSMINLATSATVISSSIPQNPKSFFTPVTPLTCIMSGGC